MHRIRARYAREADPAAPDAALQGNNYAQCPHCKGKHFSQPGGNAGCGVCKGRGSVLREELVPEESDALPESLEPLAEFLEACFAIEAHGVRDAVWYLAGDMGLRLGWHPWFLAAHRIFTNELARLEHEDRVAEAGDARKRHRENKRKGGG